jgi:hypothetical protein
MVEKFEEIPTSVKEMYDLKYNEEKREVEIIVNNTYTSITNAEFSESKKCIYIKNDKAKISIWKNLPIVHTTIF